MRNSRQILCVSPNPAIDKRIRLAQFRVGQVNRASMVDPAPGGKAAHVAFAARALGTSVKWLGFLGGPEGENCGAGLRERGIMAIPIAIAGRTRMNLEFIDDATGCVTEILEPGPTISAAEMDALLSALKRELDDCALVVASGSLPPGVPASFYAELVNLGREAGRPVLVDTSGEALSHAASARPFLIKPNRQEAEALLGRHIANADDALTAASHAPRPGPEVVVISLGAEGAVVLRRDCTLRGTPPQLKPLSPVGSGDSFMAGWATGMMRGLPDEECLRLAIACGAANCLADSPGCLSPEAVQRLAPEVRIRSCSL